MPPGDFTLRLPRSTASPRVATRSQQAELVGIDYDALEQAEKKFGGRRSLPEASSDDDA